MVEYLIIAGAAVVILAVLVISKHWGNWNKMSSNQWAEAILDKRITDVVLSLMGTAYKMKENNPDGKLTKDEREFLQKEAAQKAVDATRSIVGEKLLESKTWPDIATRINAAVSKAKMEWNHAGIEDFRLARELVEGLTEEEEEEEEEEDED